MYRGTALGITRAKINDTRTAALQGADCQYQTQGPSEAKTNNNSTTKALIDSEVVAIKAST